MDVETLSYKQLRKLAKQLGLNAGGKAESLRTRVLSKLEELPSASGESDQDSQPESEGLTARSRRSSINYHEFSDLAQPIRSGRHSTDSKEISIVGPDSTKQEAKNSLKGEMSIVSEDEDISFKPKRGEPSTSEEDEITFKPRKPKKKGLLQAKLRDGLEKAKQRRSRVFEDEPVSLKKENIEHGLKKVKRYSKTVNSRLPRPLKAPNFSDMHKKNFGKMEALDDYLVRKEERARALTPGKPFSRVLSEVKQKETGPKFEPGPPNINFHHGPLEFTAGGKSAVRGASGVVKAVPRDRRHMAAKLGPASREKTPHSEAKENFIRGVRSNRRFILQMKMRGVEAE